MADLARGAQSRAHRRLKSEREAIAQIAPLRHDAADDGALGVGLDQWRDKVELVHGDKLEDFAAHLAVRIARQGVDDLQMLGALGAEEVQQFTVSRTAFDKRIKAGAGA